MEAQRKQDAAQGLCDTGALAQSGDFAGATDTYFTETHSYVHELAGKLRSVDPTAAAELLEADQRFEAMLAARTSDAELMKQVSLAMAAAFAQAVVAAGLPKPSCAEPSDA